ncbi:MAG: hypothetical protein NXY57DRAFT_862450, partial [Lentinula lateritia]
PAELKSRIRKEFGLNSEQQIAFDIISSMVIYREILKVPEWITKPALVMNLTGPGGTGKTHVIWAVQEVMKHYGVEYAYRALAPTGNAASLVNGKTIHSGLNI